MCTLMFSVLKLDFTTNIFRYLTVLSYKIQDRNIFIQYDQFFNSSIVCMWTLRVLLADLCLLFLSPG